MVCNEKLYYLVSTRDDCSYYSRSGAKAPTNLHVCMTSPGLSQSMQVEEDSKQLLDI